MPQPALSALHFGGGGAPSGPFRIALSPILTWKVPLRPVCTMNGESLCLPPGDTPALDPCPWHLRGVGRGERPAQGLGGAPPPSQTVVTLWVGVRAVLTAAGSSGLGYTRCPPPSGSAVVFSLAIQPWASPTLLPTPAGTGLSALPLTEGCGRSPGCH